jgi:hypothetical protein
MKKNFKTYKESKYPFDYMGKGDSFIYADYSANKMGIITSIFTSYIRTRKLDEKLAVRKVRDEIRVWKIKGKRRKHGVNKTAYTVERNIPLAKRSTRTGHVIYPFSFMQAGDSFIYGEYSRNKMQYIGNSFRAYTYKMNLDWKCATRKINGKVRIWKTKGDKIMNGVNLTKYKIDKNIPLPPVSPFELNFLKPNRKRI